MWAQRHSAKLIKGDWINYKIPKVFARRKFSLKTSRCWVSKGKGPVIDFNLERFAFKKVRSVGASDTHFSSCLRRPYFSWNN